MNYKNTKHYDKVDKEYSAEVNNIAKNGYYTYIEDDKNKICRFDAVTGEFKKIKPLSLAKTIMGKISPYHIYPADDTHVNRMEAIFKTIPNPFYCYNGYDGSISEGERINIIKYLDDVHYRNRNNTGWIDMEDDRMKDICRCIIEAGILVDDTNGNLLTIAGFEGLKIISEDIENIRRICKYNNMTLKDLEIAKKKYLTKVPHKDIEQIFKQKEEKQRQNNYYDICRTLYADGLITDDF